MSKLNIQIEVVDDAAQRLMMIAATNGTDEVEVIRRALAVYDFVWRNKQNGGITIVQDGDGKQQEVDVK